jgi:hypothetical protein
VVGSTSDHMDGWYCRHAGADAELASELVLWPKPEAGSLMRQKPEADRYNEGPSSAGRAGGMGE